MEVLFGFGRKNLLALVSVGLAALMFGLEISSVPVILPTLEKLLHGDLKDMQWIMNAYTIACTTVLMAAGTLADRYGRKKVFLLSLILFGITSLVCGLSGSMSVLIISRFFQGVGGGTMVICQIAALSHQFSEKAQRSKAFAIWGIIFGVGLGFGPIIGGMIVAVSNWRWVFLVHAPLAVIAWILANISLEESRDPQAQKLDIGGMVTLSISVFCLNYYITKGPDLGFGSMAALGILALALISFIIFLWVEKSSEHPMFDFSVFRIRNFMGAIVGSAGMNFSFWPFMIYLPIYLQKGLGYDIVIAGWALLAYTLPPLVIPPLAERLTLRYQPRLIIPIGLFTIGLGFLYMWYINSTGDTNWLGMLPGALLAGIGLGLTNTPVTNTATGSVPGSRAGMASGIDMSARLITLAINIALMGAILPAGIRHHLMKVSPGSMDAAQLHLLSERIASGDLVQGASHAALMHGFGWVMLYGGIGVIVLALTSYRAFAAR